MRIMLLFFIFLFNSLAASAQTPERTTNPTYNKVSVTFLPLALADDPSFPTIQGGIEYRLSPSFSLLAEAGVRYRKSMYEQADTGFYTPQGIKLKAEIRYYDWFRGRLKKIMPFREGTYIGANLFYIKDIHNTAIRYEYNKDSTQTRDDHFGVQKTVFGINLLTGSKIPVTKWFSIDCYVGLGIRIRQINTTNKEYDAGRDLLKTWRHPNIQDIRNTNDAKAGNNVLANLTAGFRLCLRL
jgi:hypothetical protein